MVLNLFAQNVFIRIYKLTLNLLTTTIVAPPSNASKWQMGFNSAFKGLIDAKLYFFFEKKYISNEPLANLFLNLGPNYISRFMETHIA